MSDNQPKLGKLYGIGVGPGDPELMTLKADRLVRQTPVIFVPVAQTDEPSLALSIAGERVDPDRQKVVSLLFPMSRNADELETAWRQAAEAIASALRTGQDCAFLTEGDPSWYSTFGYMVDRLQKDLPGLVVEIVPGISSINAAAARIGQPLALGQETVAVLAGASIEEVRAALQSHTTVVLLKASRSFDRLLDLLEEMKLVEVATLVERATAGNERVVTDIRSLRGQKPGYFSLLIIRQI